MIQFSSTIKEIVANINQTQKVTKSDWCMIATALLDESTTEEECKVIDIVLGLIAKGTVQVSD